MLADISANVIGKSACHERHGSVRHVQPDFNYSGGFPSAVHDPAVFYDLVGEKSRVTRELAEQRKEKGVVIH